MKTKSSSLKIRVTDEEHALLALRATREGVTISSLIRIELGLDRGAIGSYADRVAVRWQRAHAAHA
jgi:hypothetical protein